MSYALMLSGLTWQADAAAADKPGTDKHRDTFAAIREAVDSRSSIADSLVYLADVYGPRLTGTPRYLEMVQWVAARLRAWGIDEVRIETYGEGHRGWEVTGTAASMVSPSFAPLDARPVCCGKSTEGEVSGVPLLVDFYDIDALRSLDVSLEGRILLHPEVTPLSRPATGKWSDRQLQTAAQRVNPVTPDGLDGPGSDVTYVERLRKDMNEGRRSDIELAEFLLSEGVAAILRSSGAPAGLVNNRIDSGLVEFHAREQPEPVPMFLLPREQHSRLLTMLQLGVEPRVSLELSTRFFDDPDLHVNLIAEIPGTDPDLKDEIVMLGAHLDSVETATGAADNAIGSATAMETLRVIKALNLQPRRTIRIALWGGEEQGLLGSSAYVEEHIGDILTGTYGGEHQKISAYFNHDNNGYDIRGIFVVGHTAIKPIFEPIFAAFEDVGASTVTIENAGGTDILVFDAAGIPSFEWIQDPGRYFTHQLHTDLDVSDLVSTTSVNRNAAIIASVIYATAMLDEMLPRKR